MDVMEQPAMAGRVEQPAPGVLHAARSALAEAIEAGRGSVSQRQDRRAVQHLVRCSDTTALAAACCGLRCTFK
jgi:hypothetical protein